jgi:tRNA pseudouridine55 synthase
MRRRRDDADVHGFLNVCKPTGFTSHDVVAVVRRSLGTRRVGHAGTLDPLAEGVLPVCVGRYTRLVDFVSEGQKGYYAELELGARTTTDDAEGEVVERRPVPDVTGDDLDRALAAFRGPILQVPPAYSAVKVAGRRAYDLARRGDAPVLAARQVTVHRLDALAWQSPKLSLLVACSKGTYVRSIVRDLGEVLACGAHLTRLVRLWVGSFGLGEAYSLDEIGAAASAGGLGSVLLPAEVALRALPGAIVEPRRALDMNHGRPWPSPTTLDVPGLARVYDSGGRLLGLAEQDAERRVWQPRLALIQVAASGPTASQDATAGESS